MNSNVVQAIGSFVAAIIGLATLSVILSNRSNSVQLLGAAGSSFAGILGAATAPVTGNGGAGSNGGFATGLAGINSTLKGVSGLTSGVSNLLNSGGTSSGSDIWAGPGGEDSISV